MNFRNSRRPGRWAAILMAGLACWSVDARAQSAVGAGPITSALSATEPTVGVLGMGPIKFAPGMTVKEIGLDSNVFDESENPKEDFVASGTPDVSMFARTRFVQVSAYGGAELTYYQKYESERSVGYSGRARVDILLSRLFPFAGFGQRRTRERPNGEIDTRANRLETEKSAGLGFQLSDHAVIYASGSRMTTHYRDAFESGVELGASLSRHSDDLSGGVRTSLTPLTTLTLRGGVRRDVFTAEESRDAESRYLDATFSFSPQAAITGSATVGFQDMKPEDPAVHPYRGLTGSVALTLPLLEVGRFNVSAQRSLDYSFNAAEAYYIGTSFNVTYTHRLVGAVDLHVHGGESLFDYGSREGSPARRETLDTADGGLGYNLRNRTRVALNYEYSRRRSAELAERNYDRRRIFLSWSYVF